MYRGMIHHGGRPNRKRPRTPIFCPLYWAEGGEGGEREVGGGKHHYAHYLDWGGGGGRGEVRLGEKVVKTTI